MHCRTALLVFAVVTTPSLAQVGFSGPGTYNQNFDTLANTGTGNAWANNSTVPGWFAFQTSGSSAVATYRANDGTSNAGDLSSFGSAGSGERALGTIAAGATGDLAYGLVVQNTSAALMAFSLGYTGEQWRDGASSSPNAQSITFSYRVLTTLPTTFADWNPAAPLPAGYTALSSLDFTSPTFLATSGGDPLNGNLAANQTVFASTSIPVTVPAGNYLILRWFDLNNTGNDHALSLDSLTVVAVPEPATVLGIAAAGLGLGSTARRRFRAARR